MHKCKVTLAVLAIAFSSVAGAVPIKFEFSGDMTDLSGFFKDQCIGPVDPAFCESYSGSILFDTESGWQRNAKFTFGDGSKYSFEFNGLSLGFDNTGGFLFARWDFGSISTPSIFMHLEYDPGLFDPGSLLSYASADLSAPYGYRGFGVGGVGGCTGGNWDGHPTGEFRKYSCVDEDVVVSAKFVAVPEPSTLALLTLGLLGMGLARRRTA